MTVPAMTVKAVHRSMIALAAVMAALSAGVGSGLATDPEMPPRPEKPMEIQPTIKGKETRPGYPSDPKELFELFDADGDGVIDRAEWKGNKMAVFFLRDHNRDIKLSRDELPGVNQAAFDAADIDGDGRLSGFEFNQAEFMSFEAVDISKTGSISKDDFIAFLTRVKTGI